MSEPRAHEGRAFDRCDECGQQGELGAHMRAHAVEIAGQQARFVVVLHVEQCTASWFAKYEADPMSAVMKTCVQCKEDGRLGPEIRTYSFSKPNGENYTALLHASDGGRDCYALYDARYRAKFAKAKEAASG